MGHYTGQVIAPKAKHVIFLFLTGGPSQLDMFDPKPLLAKEYRASAPRRSAASARSVKPARVLPSRVPV